MVGVRAKVLGRMGWTTSPYLRASALSCPSLVVYRTGALGSRPYHWPRCCLTLPRARPSLSAGPMPLEHVITVPLLSAITHQPRRKAAVFLVRAQEAIIPIEHHVPSPAVLLLSGRGEL